MEDSICAISTSMGIGAISIVRVTGPETINIVDSIFDHDLKNASSHTIHYGHIKYNEEVIDEVLVMLMKGPKTYTTEDTIEINCHGGINTTKKIMEILLASGCRLAEPGEFTKRAYLNGRINLLEAESVNDLIVAKTDAARKLAINNVDGKLSKKISNLREKIAKILANIEVNIDYPEYTDELDVTNELMHDYLTDIKKDLDSLVNGAKNGRLIKEGVNVAIIGKPNVGKSSILNSLLDEDKAIVTNIPGTTRDIVEGTITIDGVAINLIDTAGIRKTDDLVEQIGVEKSEKTADNSDIILFVLNMTSFNSKLVSESSLRPKILTSSPVLSNVVKDATNTVTEIYDFVDVYVKDKDSDKFNYNAIDTMLKNKIITPEYVEKLVKKRKIEVKNIDNLIEKYKNKGDE